VLLRRFATSDFEDVYAYIGDPAVTRYLIVETQTREQTRAWLDERLRDYDRGPAMTWWPWALVFRPENRVVGGCALRNFARDARRIEVAYALGERYWRRGLMTEALGLLLNFCFTRLELNRVEAMVLRENAASCRLLEKLGFRCEGVMRQRDFFKGMHHDMAMYAVLASEWRNASH
jgi:ribosomal-protein-alanine N-acetyltransferase